MKFLMPNATVSVCLFVLRARKYGTGSVASALWWPRRWEGGGREGGGREGGPRGGVYICIADSCCHTALTNTIL